MSVDTTLQTPPAPSPSTLAKTTAVVVAAAGVILITLVLPAEYAIDPLGTGRRLGLTDIAQPKLAVAEAVKSEGAPLAPTLNGPIGEYPGEFKLDRSDIVLEPYEYVEYKYRLEKSATMLYSWEASAGVKHDFHGERQGDTPDAGPAEQSFDKQDRRQSTGSYTAPFSGIHGWYWENPGAETIRIHVTTAGFYTSAVEIRSDRTRRTHTLRALATIAGPTTAAPASTR